MSRKTDEEQLGKAAINQQQQQQRRKGASGAREWTVISESGDLRVEEMSKQSIMKQTGLPARDLRALDPVFMNPSTILGRERAIVVNLEHIKAIVTATEVFMLKSTNPLVVQFINYLKDRISTTRDIPVPNNEDGNPIPAGHKVLPFEFRALEACLESTCRCFEAETQTLEEEAYPALDQLSSKISTLNLERVRQIKSRLVAISGRVQKVRDELEHLLDDDNDMAEMYLTERLQGRSMEQRSANEGEEFYNEDVEINKERNEGTESEHNSGTFTTVKPNVEELEMLFEAYFAQIDGNSQKLLHMKEYVDDTEDYINIMLDDKQNQLLQMGVMLSFACMILNAGIVVFGIFGMNFTDLALFGTTPVQFWETAFGTVVGCVALYLIAIGWGKSKRLL